MRLEVLQMRPRRASFHGSLQTCCFLIVFFGPGGRNAEPRDIGSGRSRSLQKRVRPRQFMTTLPGSEVLYRSARWKCRSFDSAVERFAQDDRLLGGFRKAALIERTSEPVTRRRPAPARLPQLASPRLRGSLRLPALALPEPHARRSPSAARRAGPSPWPGASLPRRCAR